VEPGRLLAGYFPGNINPRRAELKLKALLDCKITCAVNLVSSEERNCDGVAVLPYEPLLAQLAAERGMTVRFINFPLPNWQAPTRAEMALILDAIDTALADGLVVYVHCGSGIGRTGTVIGCWIARHDIATGQAALGRLQALRQNDPRVNRLAPETGHQRDLVRSWLPGE
jgi:hypothetical protein